MGFLLKLLISFDVPFGEHIKSITAYSINSSFRYSALDWALYELVKELENEQEATAGKRKVKLCEK